MSMSKFASRADYWKHKAEQDATRLLWLLKNVGFDGLCGIDLHERACFYAEQCGNEEPTDEDYLASLRDAIDKGRGYAGE